MAPDYEEAREPRDWTKHIWLGVIVLFLAMVAGLWLSGKPRPNTSSVHARHILVAFDAANATERAGALELVTSLRERIENGESFATLARQYSDDPGSAQYGGDLGYESRGVYAASFDAYVWSAPIGQLSGVVVTQHGFHLIEVLVRFVSEAEQYEQDLERRVREEMDGGSGG